MSLEALNKELQMFFESKAKEQSKECRKRKNDILSPDPLYF
jgi:hypothetical protein